MVREDNAETTVEKKPISKKISRRNFLKTSVGMGIGAAGAAMFGFEVPGGTKVVNADTIIEHNDMPVEISADYKRYDQKQNVIMRALAGDPAVKPAFDQYFGKHNGLIPQSAGDGYGRLEMAMVAGAWSVEDGLNGYHAPGFASQGVYKWDNSKVNPDQYKFESPAIASNTVKKAATFFGVNLVGIVPYDERWVFSRVYDIEKKDSVPNVLPFQPTHAIVMAIAMDYEGFESAPAPLELAATGNIYSNMGIVANKVAAFVHSLGYKAIACGNDTALSVPMAIQAGLGELSRIGILITPQYGPRVRLFKVFTDMPLAIDKPITFGAMEFCKTCKKCADSCPSGAISKDGEPSFEQATVSSNPGVKKWAANAEKCLKQWGEAGTDCGMCIKVCPYNKIDEWHHDLAKLATKTPARPLLRYFDDLFGYGKVSVKDATKKFWNK